MSRFAGRWRAALCAALGLLVAGCTTPIHVDRRDPQVVHRVMTGNAISTGGHCRRVPTALAGLHRIATTGEANPDAMFALAELSFRHAADTGKAGYYRAAAVYAFA
jgi:hypothetical protein